MLVKVNGSELVQYPYTWDQLRSDFPNTSFPYDLTNVDLTEFGAAAVVRTEPPAVVDGQGLVEGMPERVRARDIDGQFIADNAGTAQDEAWIWRQTWIVVDNSAAE